MKISEEGAHFAVTVFDSSQYHPIDFKDHTNLTSFIDAVDRKVNHTNGWTHTFDGLNAALNHMFNESNGMRSNVQRVLFFMTDGACWHDDGSGGNEAHLYGCTQDGFAQMRQNFQSRGIKIIGLGVTSGANVDEILQFVNRQNYHYISNFATLFDPGLPRKFRICDGVLIICIYDIKQ